MIDKIVYPFLNNVIFTSSITPAVNSILEWVQQNQAYDIKDITNYGNSNMHSTAGAVERVKPIDFQLYSHT